jgi:hypothetical protein
MRQARSQVAPRESLRGSRSEPSACPTRTRSPSRPRTREPRPAGRPFGPRQPRPNPCAERCKVMQHRLLEHSCTFCCHPPAASHSFRGCDSSRGLRVRARRKKASRMDATSGSQSCKTGAGARYRCSAKPSAAVTSLAEASKITVPPTRPRFRATRSAPDETRPTPMHAESHCRQAAAQAASSNG